MIPRKITVSAENTLELHWQDGSTAAIKTLTLRKYCPCATCAQERSQWSPTYIPLYSSEQLHIKSIESVGNYAIAIIWKDGHKTGIYTFEFLRKVNELT
jgi:DUF971 family protein